jgi:tetratricopeptide (TPR) repeat protein
MNVLMARIRYWLVLVSVISVCTACPRPPDDTKPQLIQLEPMYFTILKKGNKVKVEDHDTGDLFAEAERHFAAGRPAEAKKLYDMVADNAAEAETRGLAWFNIALCELSMEQPGAALTALQKAEASSPGADKQQVTLLKVQAHAMAGQWQQVDKLGKTLLKETLEPVWAAKVNLYLGQSRYAEDLLDEAQDRYKKAIDLVLHNVSISAQYQHSLLASAYFHLGQVYRRMFGKIQLLMPMERMSLDVPDKLALMRKAEEVYLLALRVRDSKWSPRAGFQIGTLYEAFAMSLLQAEEPDTLTAYERQVYTEELNKKVLPLLSRSREIHRKNVTMCETYLLRSPFKKKSRSKIAALDKTIANLSRAIGPEEKMGNE